MIDAGILDERRVELLAGEIIEMSPGEIAPLVFLDIKISVKILFP